MNFTYSELADAILRFTEDASEEFSASLPTIIKLGQERVLRDLDLEIFKQTFSGSFTAGSNLVTKPSGLIAISSFFWINSTAANELTALQPRSYEYCLKHAETIGQTGVPKFYNDGYSDTQIFVSKAPVAAYGYKIRGTARPDYISASLSENWISKYQGDLLLYACLVESERFLFAVQEGKPQEWEAAYNQRLPQARVEAGNIARTEYSPPQSNQEARSS